MKSSTAIEGQDAFGRSPLVLACVPLVAGNKSETCEITYPHISPHSILSFADLCTEFASVYLPDDIVIQFAQL